MTVCCFPIGLRHGGVVGCLSSSLSPSGVVGCTSSGLGPGGGLGSAFRSGFPRNGVRLRHRLRLGSCPSPGGGRGGNFGIANTGCFADALAVAASCAGFSHDDAVAVTGPICTGCSHDDAVPVTGPIYTGCFRDDALAHAACCTGGFLHRSLC